MKQLFKNGLIIEILVLISTLVYQFFLGTPESDEIRWYDTVYFLGIIVVLPFYLIGKTIYATKMKIKQNAVFFSYALAFTPMIISSLIISNYFEENNISSYMPTFDFFGLFEVEIE